MIRVLLEPKNAIIKQYQHLFAIEGATLEFTDDALHELAKRAMERGTGARALRAVIDELMLDLMYDLPESDRAGHTYVVDQDTLTGKHQLNDLLRPVEARESA